jgi:hypothetical protein
MRYRPCATWRVRCERVRRRTCLHRETASPVRNESKTGHRANRKGMQFRGLPRNGESPSRYRPWIDICCREHGEIRRPEIVRLPLGGDRARGDAASSAASNCLSEHNNQASLIKHCACCAVSPSRSKISNASFACCIPSLWRPISRFTSDSSINVLATDSHFPALSRDSRHE